MEIARGPFWPRGIFHHEDSLNSMNSIDTFCFYVLFA